MQSSEPIVELPRSGAPHLYIIFTPVHEGRKTAYINIPTPKNVCKTFTLSYDGHKTIQGSSANPGTKMDKVATSPQKKELCRRQVQAEHHTQTRPFNLTKSPTTLILYRTSITRYIISCTTVMSSAFVLTVTRMAEFNKLPFDTYRCRTLPILQDPSPWKWRQFRW